MDDLIRMLASKVTGDKVYQVFLKAKKDGKDKIYISTNGEAETKKQAVKEAIRAAKENGYTNIRLSEVKILK
jgi:hypothetical protein